MAHDAAHDAALDGSAALLPADAPGPALDPDHNDRRPASRHSRLSRRESRLGFKNLFARSRPSRDLDTVPDAPPDLTSMRARASMADLPQSSPANQSDAHMPPLAPWHHVPASPDPSPPSTSVPPAKSHQRESSKSSKQPKTASWSMPPLFKAFPQAVRHVILPAATISADAILRLNAKRHALGLPDENAISPDISEKDKKKHRRHASSSADCLEWTTKIFVLVSSGHLLQYAGDGHFDRMPEKILRLGPSSAAFATDAIPGRHWVVRVSSAADADGIPAPEHRSLFSKLPFRADRRNTSNLLMVFESALVMETWITVLRGEIERVGGKKNLSETGRPKTMESSQPPADRSKRILMARSLPRLRNPGPSRAHSHATAPRLRGGSFSDGARVMGPDAVDDDSTSNSGVSQDERHLDNLREHSNRLSIISSGQRTVVTSAGPSPEGSPTRELVAATPDETQFQPGEAVDMVRPRPNASDIASRRQSSMQAVAPLVDAAQPDQAGMRSPVPHGHTLGADGAPCPLGLHPTPNFSVPHSSNRRFSHARISPIEVESAALLEPSRLARGKPPPALRATRALPAVMDQPLLRESGPPRPATAYRVSRPPSPTKYVNHQRLCSASRGRERAGSVGTIMTRESSAVRTGRSVPPTRRRQESMDGLRSPPLTPLNHDVDKYQSSFLDPSTPTSQWYGSPRSATEEEHPGRERRSTAGICSRPARMQSQASSPHIKVQMTEKALLNRRSMPQLTAGPPPAPPPTRALPPIPQDLASKA